ncbi:hypothetical protein NIES4071_48130 [Calothrix sp. NIES-4071]|nr:hypothetical protein NIES4071_48130 [Calothrix sp. NIES-4071]BAZ59125.1 hypothetical protein NIES4105_48070 [Calothrix sp. NIES-4105]
MTQKMKIIYYIASLISFKSKDDLFDYQLENNPRFLARIEKARQSLREGKGVKLEDLDF